MSDIDDINEDAQERKKKLQENSQKKKFFKVKKPNEWMDEANKTPPPNMLFGELWYEGEVCILFSDTNLGKSILAVQLADSISRGRAIEGFKLEAPPQMVLYFDFELSAKQFEARYSNNYQDHYQFSPELMERAEINSDMELPEGVNSFEEYLYASLLAAVTEYKAKVIIVDNITYLKHDTEKARDASPLMKELKALKDKYGISILALAHTPKRDMTKPITKNDLMGSSMLMTFCDSSFSIGASHKDSSLRYIIQIKQRATEQVYGARNVALFTIHKPENYLHFKHVGFGAEWQHLKQEKEGLGQEQIERIHELHQQGIPQRKIADEVGVSVSTVNRHLKKK